jgi:hypothetical protein
LPDDREDEVTAVLLIFIAEVAIKIKYDCRRCFVLGLDVFNNPRAGRWTEWTKATIAGNNIPQDALARSRYKNGNQWGVA